MIGLADLIEGLYFLTTQASPSTKPHPVIASVHSKSSYFLPQEALWHFRLGHLSNRRLHSLKQSFPCIKIDDNSVCDICHYSRHKDTFSSQCK